MNQILLTNSNFISKSYKNQKNIYGLIFILSTTICILTIFYLLYSNLKKITTYKKTYLLQNKYIINSLYISTLNYPTLNISNNISIIGSISIPKINISYPILERTSDELLKISVCRFSGPLPNRIGNLCIAGHNYRNKLMFSNLYKLNVDDSIFITDLNNTKVEYIIYDKFKTQETNLDCTKSSNNVEITLITCNSSNNSERIIIKAKMKGT